MANKSKKKAIKEGVDLKENKVYMYFWKGDKVYARTIDFTPETAEDDLSDEVFNQLALGLRITIKQAYAIK